VNRQTRTSALLLLLLAAPCWAQSGEVIRLSGGDDRIEVLDHAAWLFDPTSEMSLHDAVARYRAGEFRTEDQPDFQYRPSRAAVWLRLAFVNEAPTDRFVVEITNARMPEVDFYWTRDDGTFRRSIAGTARPYYEREIVFLKSATETALPTGEPQELFIRVANNGDMRFDVVLWRLSEFVNYAANVMVFHAIMIGLMLAMIIFHGVIFVSMREMNYLYLTVFLAAWLLWYLAFTATGSIVLWSDAPMLANRAPTIFVFLICATFAVFAHSMLDMRRYARHWSKVVLGYSVACLAGIVFSLISDNLFRVHLSILMAALGPVIIIGVSLRMLKRAKSRVQLFMLTWVAVHIGGITAIIVTSYFSTADSFGAHWVNVIVFASAVLWSLDLTGRVKYREREQRRMLEETVTERTRELTQALHDVKQLSGLLPICASCKKIRDDHGYWSSVESYIAERTDAKFTHGVCPECRQKLYPDL